MKKLINLTSIILLFLCFTISCKKEETPGTGQIDFTLNIGEVQSSLKSTGNLTASYVVVTIEDNKGKIVKNSEKLELYKMNGSYITQPISLISGSYKLTKFLVLDSGNNVIYASPAKGSAQAYLVKQSLPLAFDAQKDGVTKLIPEVLTTKENTPESFGYTTFSFNVTETFDFLVGAFIYNETIKNYQLTTAEITITNGNVTIYKGPLSAKTNATNTNVYDSLGVTNKITLPAGYSSYTLAISKTGYKTYSKTFTKDELKLYYRSADKGPLVVILEALPVEDNSFYIRAKIGNESLNYTILTVKNYVFSYTNPVSFNLHYLGFEKDSITWCRSLRIFLSGTNGNLSKLKGPFAVPNQVQKVSGEVQFLTGLANPQFGNNDNVNYVGVAASPGIGDIVMTVESIENNIITGKFSGKVRTMTGLILPVTNGEFRGKLRDIIY